MIHVPRHRLLEVAAPSGAVVSLADLKLIRRIDDASEDALLADMERAAVEAVEQATQRLLIPRQVVMRLPGLPARRTPIALYGGAVTALTSVVADGEEITGSTALGDSPAVLVPAADWPVVTGEGYPVTITYTAGFAAVPPGLVQAIKLLVGAMDYQREAVAAGQAVTEVPLGFDHMVAPHRIRPI